MPEIVQTSTPGRGAPPRGRLLGVAVFVLVFALLTGGVLVLREVVRKPGEMGGIPGSSLAGTKPGARGASLDKLLEEANIAMGQQEYLRAESILSRAVESFPAEQRAHLQYAQALVTRKKFADAYAQYAAAIALTPKPAGAAPTAAADPKLHFEAGTVANEAGLVERAEEHYSLAQAADPAEPRYPLYLAMVQIKLGKDAAALAGLVRATKLNPDLAVAWGTMAELSLRQNQLGLAMQHIDTARRLEPQAARWRVDEAKILKRRADKGDTERALQLLLSLDKADRMQPDVLRAIGECYGLLQRPADAAAMFAEAARLRPTDARIAADAALWFHRAGNEAEALRYGKIAQELQTKARGSDEATERRSDGGEGGGKD